MKESAEVDLAEFDEAPSARKRRFAKKVPFVEVEDDKLLLLVRMYGEGKWKQIADIMIDRSARQCRERYANYINPNLKIGNWTKEEDATLERLFNEHGPRWSKLAQTFGNRSSQALRSRYTELKLQNFKCANTRPSETKMDVIDSSFRRDMQEDVAFETISSETSISWS